MSRIFLSHSSKDDFEAVAIGDWLRENGWDDVFLDVDPAQGIHPGERWERALHEHATRCEAVVFLVSRNWLVSDWCRREYELARKLNKRIFIVLISDVPIADLPTFLTETLQAVSLAAGDDHQVFRVLRPGTHEERHVTFSREGLARLKAGLTQAGLDPRFFAWPPSNEPNRAPYRGLEPLEAIDAGIFFGRDAPVIEALDVLRGLREGACPRLLVILGASGAGKSSFLRAGLLPRLARDDRSFLTLGALRPERAAITGINGFVATLAAAFAEKGMAVTRAELREAVAHGSKALRSYLRDLVAKESDGGESPTLVLAVDQAEELFRPENAQEGDALLTVLHDLASTDDPALIVIFVIRSDSYDALQHAKPLDGLAQKAFPLLPMPRGSYQTVIEGPVQRLRQAGRKFEIDPSLTQALLDDLEKGGGSDALPLLAFTLAQLFSDHEAVGRLTRQDYEKFDGLKGAIDAAILRTFAEADKDSRIPKDRDARLALLRRGLIPWLAGIDPQTRTPRRRRAPDAQIPQEARPLVDLLVEQRLLTRAVDDATGTTTLEPAHETLLRQWGSLKGWLEEDFARLVALEGVQRAARDWDANARDMAWAAHGGNRLEEATRLDNRPDLAAMLDATDRAYLAACREKEKEARDREVALVAAQRRAAQRTRIGLVASTVLAVLAIGAAIFGFLQAKVATEQKGIVEQQKADVEQQKTVAEQQKTIAERRSAILAAKVSQSFSAEGAVDRALLLMLDAAHVFDDKSAPDEILIAFTKALEKSQNIEAKTLAPNVSTFPTGDALLLFDPISKDIWKLTDRVEPKQLYQGAPSDGAIIALRSGLTTKDYIVLRANGVVERIDAATGAKRTVGVFPAAKGPPGVKYETADRERITDDGLVTREFDGNSNAGSSYFYQILDADNGRILEGTLDGAFTLFHRGPGGSVYATDPDQHLFQIRPAKDRLVAQRVSKLAEREDARLRYGDCIGKMPDAMRLTVVKEFESLGAGTFECTQRARGYLIAQRGHTSSGEERTDTLYRPNGKKVAVRDVLEKAIKSVLPPGNFSWVDAFPAVSASSGDKKDYLAVIQNRTVYVLVHDPDQDVSKDAEDWSLLLQYRHPDFVDKGRFLGADKLLVTESDSGRIVIHYFGDQPHEKLFATPIDNIVGTDTPIEPFHKGTCVGVNFKDNANMSDGRSVVWKETEGKTEIRLPGPKSALITLGNDATCVQFSNDWSRMLVVKDNGIIIYHFPGVLDTGTLAGNEIGEVPVKNATSAFFVGNGMIVVSNFTNRVLLWRQVPTNKTWVSSEIYKGDN
jgi:conflict system STAND superfamily ATPase/TIR domain-containing protein